MKRQALAERSMAPEKRQRGFPWPENERGERVGKRLGSKKGRGYDKKNQGKGRHPRGTDRVAGGTQGGWRAEGGVGRRQAGQQQGTREEGGTRVGTKALGVLRSACKAQDGEGKAEKGWMPTGKDKQHMLLKP